MTSFKRFVMIAVASVAASLYADSNHKDRILTPPVAATPRINGARIIGARPGSPFLFKVPVSGDKPIRYAARNLPEGLAIDPETGIISGTVETAGEYTVELAAGNDKGTAQRELKIVIGDTIALTPPMGWNSWYCHSELVSEEAIRETAKAMVEKGLVDHGWTYVNIDDCWQGVRGGEYNAIQPNDRFHDMKGMCDYVHSLGLKIGIYSTPWVGTYAGFIGGSAPNPEGDYSGAYLPEDERLQPFQFFGRYPGSRLLGLRYVGEWFNDKDAVQWAEWGFDYVKMDWNPNDVPTTKRIAEDLQNCGRDIVLSLSNTAPFKNAEGLSQYANCWRTTKDVRERWDSISEIGFSQAEWQSFTRPGHWNDIDMLQVGNLGTPNRQNSEFRPTRLKPDEQYTQMSLWCLLSSPLILSCDIASLDDFTLSLLTNDEVIDVNQDPAGQPAKRVFHDETTEIWAKPLEDGSLAVGLFNIGNEKREITVSWEALGLTGKHTVRDLWRQKDLGSFSASFKVEVNRHGVVLVKVR